MTIIEKKSMNPVKEIKTTKGAKTGDQVNFEQELIPKLEDYLMDGSWMTSNEWSWREIEYINTLNLLTTKPIVYLLNFGRDTKIDEKQKILDEVNKWVVENKCAGDVIDFSVKDQSFDELNSNTDIIPQIESIKNLSYKGYYALDLEQFFTAGANQVKAWTIRSNTSGPRAGAVIHGDFEKAFLSVEVIKPAELFEHGSENTLKKLGKLYTENKDYMIEDGDILNFKVSKKK